MTQELYKRYRPTKLKQIVGNPEAVKSLKKMAKKRKVPHAIMMLGKSGCGKTTLARILAMMLGALPSDIEEVNSGDFRGIETIREMRSNMGRAPFGKCRVFILNEVHQYRKDAQDAMLQILEDTPNHVYFILTTTDPHKMQEAIRTRCTDIKVNPLTTDEMEGLLGQICSWEKVKISSDVREKIIEVADGSPRKALVILDHILNLKSKKEQIRIIENQDLEKQVVKLGSILMNPYFKWKDAIKLIKGWEEDPEQIRRMILGYANAVLLGKKDGKSPEAPHPRAVQIINCFSSNYFDVGKAGLLWSVFELYGSRGKRRK